MVGFAAPQASEVLVTLHVAGTGIDPHETAYPRDQRRYRDIDARLKARLARPFPAHRFPRGLHCQYLICQYDQTGQRRSLFKGAMALPPHE